MVYFEVHPHKLDRNYLVTLHHEIASFGLLIESIQETKCLINNIIKF